MSYLVGVIPDDTFYYLKIARNFANTGYSSFDGVNPTNGYHPAWMILLAMLSKVVPDRAALVRAAIILAFAIHLTTSIIVVRVFENWMSRSLAFVFGSRASSRTSSCASSLPKSTPPGNQLLGTLQ